MFVALNKFSHVKVARNTEKVGQAYARKLVKGSKDSRL